MMTENVQPNVKPIMEMTIEEVVDKVLDRYGIRVTPDSTGMGYKATHDFGTTRIAVDSNRSMAYWAALQH
ncbi:MAG: hypothetical protein ACXACD_22435, partial [Candidatus Thorarchaeota archaeon]